MMMNRVAISFLALMAAAPAVATPTKVSAPGAATALPAMGAGRFAAEIAAFSQPHAVPARGAATLFMGSSSIRLWDVAQSVPALRPINRGFGGATVRDVLFHYDQLVAGLRPSSVVVYVGENDIAEGAPPDEVAADVLELLGKLRADMPQARIAYLSMKPTPRRLHLYPKMEAVNAAVRAKAGRAFDYLDVAAPLLKASGEPDAHLFTVDGLHMNARGYSVWNGIVDRWLKPEAPAQKVADKGVATS
jgi:lysophospholipase L1-like esterase